MRAPDARFFTGRRTVGTTSGLGAAFFALAFGALRTGFFVLAAFFLAPLPGFLPLPLAMPSSLPFEVVSFYQTALWLARHSIGVFTRRSVFPIAARHKRIARPMRLGCRLESSLIGDLVADRS
jgi:hypothetical protein